MTQLQSIINVFTGLINTVVGFAKTIMGSKYAILLIALLILGKTGLIKMNLGMKRGKH